MSRYNYRRRLSREVPIGKVTIGGSNPIALQSMTNTNTNDTEASVAQVIDIAKAGGDVVRLTTQGVREAENMAAITRGVREAGYDTPLVADVHFNPKAAYAAAATSDKVRINPGNFVDVARTFVKLEFTDEEYAEEIGKIRRSLLPLLEICRQHGTTLRLGVNHGSLSDRIMSRYGDTPEGMAESVMEFLRICREEDFHRIVISIKASNTLVMVRTVRLLVRLMEAEGMDYPLHLGVTEAGDGEDGRVKSAAGMGALLAEGIGDTIRVSLSEDPAHEIPVARRLRDYITRREGHSPIPEPEKVLPGAARDHAAPLVVKADVRFPVVGFDIADVPDNWHKADASESIPSYGDELPVVLTSHHVNRPGELQSWIDRFVAAGNRNPVVVSLDYDTADEEELMVEAAADFGTLLINGYASGIEIKAPHFAPEMPHRVALGILQAVRLRTSKTEYIACPGCGRTMFDLQQTLQEVRKATAHLKGLKIGVMGCIVNGPGEMADADYGYVGAGVGKISLYKGKELVLKNIDSAEAVPAMIELLKANGDWRDPQ